MFFSHETFLVRKKVAENFENLEISKNPLKNQDYQRKKYFPLIKFEIFRNFVFSFSKLCFFIEKFGVRKKIGPLNRCEILQRIHFSHSRGDQSPYARMARGNRSETLSTGGTPDFYNEVFMSGTSYPRMWYSWCNNSCSTGIDGSTNFGSAAKSFSKQLSRFPQPKPLKHNLISKF